jgi:hypothetical protein
VREDNPERDYIWFTWAKNILSDGLEKFPKSTRLHLLNAYIHQEKLNNKFKALYEMMITDENKPQIQEEFSIFRYKYLSKMI